MYNFRREERKKNEICIKTRERMWNFVVATTKDEIIKFIRQGLRSIKSLILVRLFFLLFFFFLLPRRVPISEILFAFTQSNELDFILFSPLHTSAPLWLKRVERHQKIHSISQPTGSGCVNLCNYKEEYAIVKPNKTLDTLPSCFFFCGVFTKFLIQGHLSWSSFWFLGSFSHERIISLRIDFQCVSNDSTAAAETLLYRSSIDDEA